MPRRLPIPVSNTALWSSRLALLSLLVAALGLYATRLRSDRFEPTLAVLALGIVLALAALVLAVAAFVTIWRSGARGLGSAYRGFFVAILVLAYPAYLAALALTLPQLADVSTDSVDPPAFAASVAARARRDGYDHGRYDARLVAQQKQAYPAIQPIVLDLTPDDALALVRQAVDAQHWAKAFATAPGRPGEDGLIEATDRSPVLGLPEDVVIRLRPQGQETRIDIRSASRLGAHDFGSNAARIERLLAEISAAARER